MLHSGSIDFSFVQRFWFCWWICTDSKLSTSLWREASCEETDKKLLSEHLVRSFFVRSLESHGLTIKAQWLMWTAHEARSLVMDLVMVFCLGSSVGVDINAVVGCHQVGAYHHDISSNMIACLTRLLQVERWVAQKSQLAPMLLANLYLSFRHSQAILDRWYQGQRTILDHRYQVWNTVLGCWYQGHIGQSHWATADKLCPT